MKNFFWFSLLCFTTLAYSQEDVTFYLANAQYTNGGTTYEVDIMISSTTGFKLGSGQLYLNYNNLAFGDNAHISSNVSFSEPPESILGLSFAGNFGPEPFYQSPITNDNTVFRVSYAWQQRLGGDVLSNDNVINTPQLLARVAFEFLPGSESLDPMVCFESLAPFDDQTFTACGSDPVSLGVMDCDNYPAEQIANDAFDCLSLLPLDLLTFQASPKAKSILLDWTSAHEVNFSGYELQRSTDGRNFQKLSWVAGKGGEANSYTYEDTEVQVGRTYYYRLLMKDVDGSTSYSDIRTALLPLTEDATTIQVQPNPAKGKFYVSFELSAATATTFKLYTADGRQVYQQHYNLQEGPNQLMINTTPYPAGMYTAVVRAAGQEWTSRVVIE